tara:strand:- start:11 stop:1132 length:1122 start_codon:yes stop_codon:yes gene_type:complete
MFNFRRENTSNIAIWFRSIDKILILTIIILFIMGVFFSFSSTSSIAAEKLNTKNYYFFIRHLIFVLMALFFVFFISYQNKNKIIKYFPYIFFFTLIFLLLVPFVGNEIKGSKRWLDLMFLPKFQPIELVKPFFVLITAKILSSNLETNIYKKYLYTLSILVSVILLLVLQPDMGQTILLLTTWLLMIFLSGINLVLLIVISLIFLISLFLLLFLFSDKFGYILLRLKSFIDPSQGNNFQSDKSLETIINGGFFGKGLGEGILKYKVPEAHTDYIVAVMSEEFGIVSILIVMLIFLLLAFQAFKKTMDINNDFIKLSVIGLTSIILIQAFIHIGVNIRLLPTTGMTLPFLSYGGSSIVGTSIIAGLILNLTKKK